MTGIEHHRAPVTEHSESDGRVGIPGKLAGAIADPSEFVDQLTHFAHNHDPATLVVHHMQVAGLAEADRADPAELLPRVTGYGPHPVDLLELCLEDPVFGRQLDHFLRHEGRGGDRKDAPHYELTQPRSRHSGRSFNRGGWIDEPVTGD